MWTAKAIINDYIRQPGLLMRLGEERGKIKLFAALAGCAGIVDLGLIGLAE